MHVLYHFSIFYLGLFSKQTADNRYPQAEPIKPTIKNISQSNGRKKNFEVSRNARIFKKSKSTVDVKMAASHATNGNNNLNSNSNLNSLLRMVEVHQQNHEQHSRDDSSDVTRCKKVLMKLKQLLPKLMRILIDENRLQHQQGEEGLQTICIVMKKLLSGSVCPHSMAFFQDGQAATVAPMLFYMLPVLLLVPNNRGQLSITVYQPQVFQIISQLSLLIRKSDLNAYIHLFQDFVLLLTDLCQVREWFHSIAPEKDNQRKINNHPSSMPNSVTSKYPKISAFHQLTCHIFNQQSQGIQDSSVANSSSPEQQPGTNNNGSPKNLKCCQSPNQSPAIKLNQIAPVFEFQSIARVEMFMKWNLSIVQHLLVQSKLFLFQTKALIHITQVLLYILATPNSATPSNCTRKFTALESIYSMVQTLLSVDELDLHRAFQLMIAAIQSYDLSSTKKEAEQEDEQNGNIVSEDADKDAKATSMLCECMAFFKKKSSLKSVPVMKASWATLETALFDLIQHKNTPTNLRSAACQLIEANAVHLMLKPSLKNIQSSNVSMDLARNVIKLVPHTKYRCVRSLFCCLFHQILQHEGPTTAHQYRVRLLRESFLSNRKRISHNVPGEPSQELTYSDPGHKRRKLADHNSNTGSTTPVFPPSSLSSSSFGSGSSTIYASTNNHHNDNNNYSMEQQHLTNPSPSYIISQSYKLQMAFDSFTRSFLELCRDPELCCSTAFLTYLYALIPYQHKLIEMKLMIVDALRSLIFCFDQEDFVPSHLSEAVDLLLVLVLYFDEDEMLPFLPLFTPVLHYFEHSSHLIFTAGTKKESTVVGSDPFAWLLSTSMMTKDGEIGWHYHSQHRSNDDKYTTALNSTLPKQLLQLSQCNLQVRSFVLASMLWKKKKTFELNTSNWYSTVPAQFFFQALTHSSSSTSTDVPNYRDIRFNALSCLSISVQQWIQSGIDSTSSIMDIVLKMLRQHHLSPSSYPEDSDDRDSIALASQLGQLIQHFICQEIHQEAKKSTSNDVSIVETQSAISASDQKQLCSCLNSSVRKSQLFQRYYPIIGRCTELRPSLPSPLRVALAQNILPLVAHSSLEDLIFYSGDELNSFFHLLNDADSNVRNAVSNVAHLFFMRMIKTSSAGLKTTIRLVHYLAETNEGASPSTRKNDSRISESGITTAAITIHDVSKGIKLLDGWIQQADAEEDAEKLHSLVIAIGSIVCQCDRSNVSDLDLLLWGLFRLVNIWSWLKPFSCQNAHDQIKRVLSEQSITWRELCMKYPNQTYPRLVRQLLQHQTLPLFIRVFVGNEVNVQVLLESSAPYVLPKLVLEENMEMIECLANMLHSSTTTTDGADSPMNKSRSTSTVRAVNKKIIRQLFLNHMEHIVKALVMSQVEKSNTTTTSSSCWTFLLQFMPEGSSIRETVGHAPYRLLNAIAWELAGERKQVARKAFLEISRYLKGEVRQNERVSSSSSIIPRDYFLALMTDLGGKVAVPQDRASPKTSTTSMNRAHANHAKEEFTSTMSYRIKALKCIHELLKLFGQQSGCLDSFVPKVMATLKSPLQIPQLRIAACKAWQTFVKMLSEESLATNLCSIVVNLLPCIQLHSPSSHQKESLSGKWRLSPSSKSHLVNTPECEGGCNDGDSQEPTEEQQQNEPTKAHDIAIDILSFLFIEKRQELKSQFRKVSFLPICPALQPIRLVIEEEIGCSDSQENWSIEEQILELTSVLQHHYGTSSGVHKVVLMHLLQVLVTREKDLLQHLLSMGQQLSSGRQEVSSVIAQLVQVLLRLSCTESSDEIKLLCAECLGAIGAIDPARMPLQMFYYDSSSNSSAASKSSSTQKKDGSKKTAATTSITSNMFAAELSIKELACVLIEKHLVNELRAAPENTDSVGFTIQELLRFLKTLSISSNDSAKSTTNNNNTTSMPEWMYKRFETKGVIQIVEPYWSTNYKVTSNHNSKTNVHDDTLDPTTIGEDVFYSCSSTYESWIIAWSKHLITLSGFTEQRIFQACRTALSSSPAIARFLLPYLIQNVLRSRRSCDYDGMKCEILTVLKDQDLFDSYHQYSSSSNNHKNTSPKNKTSSSSSSSASSRHHQCAQTIFSTLLDLQEWCSAKEKNPSPQHHQQQRHASSCYEDDHEKEYLEEFLKDIPSRVLAEAAYTVKAYARALQYFEIHLRQQGASPIPIYNQTLLLQQQHGSMQPTANILKQSQLSHVLKITHVDARFLQRIYSCTEEPDELIGLATQRRLKEATTDVKWNFHAHVVSNAMSSDISNTHDHQYWMDQVIDHEALGEWEQALLCYEQALQLIHWEGHDSQHRDDTYYRGGVTLSSSQLPLSSSSQHHLNVKSPTTLNPLSKSPQSEACETQLMSALVAGTIHAMVKLGRFEGAMQHIRGVLSQHPQILPAVFPHALECSWRLSRWTNLAEFTRVYPQVRSADPDVRLAHCMLSLSQHSQTLMISNLRLARLALLGPLAAACRESYQRAYPLLYRLHVLHELEHGFLALNELVVSSSERHDRHCENLNHLSQIWTQQRNWDSRLNLLPPVMKFREPVLACRRVMLQQLGVRDGLLDDNSGQTFVNSEMAKNWLQCAKMSRKSGDWQTATSAVRHAKALGTPHALIEAAKIVHAQGNVYQALQILEPIPIPTSEFIRMHSSSLTCQIDTDNQHNANHEQNQFRAKLLLLTTNWIQEAQQQQGTQVIERYKAVVKLNEEWEKGYYYLAKYYQVLLETSRDNHNHSPSSDGTHEFLILVLTNYMSSLKCGTKYLLRSLPRLLTLWFEFGEVYYMEDPKDPKDPKSGASSKVKSVVQLSQMSSNHAAKQDLASSKSPKSAQKYADMAEILNRGVSDLPVVEWMSCLAQVASRICHPNPAVVTSVKRILIRVMVAFPKQAMWKICGLARSLNRERRQRAEEVVTMAQRQLPNIESEAISEGMRLFDELIQVSAVDPQNQRKMELKLSRLRRKLMMPIKDALIITCTGAHDDREPTNHHHSQMVYIRGFYDKADVMMSKEKPKRIRILGRLCV